MSLSSVLLYSPRCLARIKRLVAGRPAYIVSGIVCRDDIAVADALGAYLHIIIATREQAKWYHIMFLTSSCRAATTGQ